MNKFFIKPIFKAAVWILGIVVLITLGVNGYLLGSRKSWIEFANQRIPVFFSAGGIYYIFPSNLMIKNARIAAQNSPAETAIEIPTIKIAFSFPRMLQKKSFFLSKVNLVEPRTDDIRFPRFLKEEGAKLAEYLKNIHKQDIQFRLKDAVYLVTGTTQPGFLNINLVFKLQDEHFSGRGELRRDLSNSFRIPGERTTRVSRGHPWRFELAGIYARDYLGLEQFSLEGQGLDTKLWGKFTAGVLRLNGYSLINTRMSAATSTTPNKPVQNNETIDANFYLLDIDTRFEISDSRIFIDRFWFKLNDIPVSIRGTFLIGQPCSLDVVIASYPSRGHKIKGQLETTDLKLAGIFSDNAFQGQTQLNLFFAKDSPLGIEKVSLEAPVFETRLKRDYTFEGDFHEASLQFLTSGNLHKMTLNGLRYFLNPGAGGLKIMKLKGPFYGGQLDGKIWFDSASAKITGSMSVQNTNAKMLEEILVHFSKVQGIVSGKVLFANSPLPEVTGHLQIDQGILSEFDFFVWLAENFRLPSVRNLEFETAQALFRLGLKGLELRDIRLQSEHTQIRGYFDVGENNLISSRLSLTFYRALLEQSPKFTAILKSFPDEESLSFDFQLSGPVHSINFQWLESEVKKKIQERIPDFIERKIDRRIDVLPAPAVSPTPANP